MDVVEDHAVAAKEAAARRDWAAALKHWDVVIDEAPDRVDGHAGKGHALLQLGRLDEADAVLAEAISRFPTHVWVTVHYGDVAARRRDWPEALRRYNEVCEKFPQSFAGPLNKAVALRELKCLAKAEALLLEAAERFPANPWLASTFADLAGRSDNWTLALERFRLVCERFPDHAIGYLGLTTALQRLDRLDEADDVIAAASERFPEHEWVVHAYATSAGSRADWIEAIRRWDWMLSRFPDNKRAVAGQAEALFKLRQLDDAKTALSVKCTTNLVLPHEHELPSLEEGAMRPVAAQPTTVLSVEPEPHPGPDTQPGISSPDLAARRNQSRQRARRTSFFRRGRS